MRSPAGKADRRTRLGIAAILVAASAQTSVAQMAECPDIGVVTDSIREKYLARFEQIADPAKSPDTQRADVRPPEAPRPPTRPADAARPAAGAARPASAQAPAGVGEQRAAVDSPAATTTTRVVNSLKLRQKTVKCGQYPQVEGNAVRWRDMTCTVPEPYIESQQIAVRVPESQRDSKESPPPGRNDAITGLSRFGPDPDRPAVDQADGLKVRSAAEAAAMKAELASAISAGFACHRANLTAVRADMVKRTDAAIAQINATIAEVKASGGNPENVGGINLAQRAYELAAQRTVALARVDRDLADLVAKEREALVRLDGPA
jgi:hypothetical protein